MADVKLYTGKKPVVEITGINNLGTAEIKSVKMADGVAELLNGMGVKVDVFKEEASLPANSADEVWLHASVEKLYRGEARNEFSITNNDGFLPRVYKLKVGQTFETNACVYDSAVFADIGSIVDEVSAGSVYAIPDASGLWRLVKVLPTDNAPVVYGKCKAVYLPNGEFGVEITIERIVL